MAKLLDFGLAKPFGPASGVATRIEEGVTPDSPAFLSPEQARAATWSAFVKRRRKKSEQGPPRSLFSSCR